MRMQTARLFLLASAELEDIETKLGKECDRLDNLGDPLDADIADDMGYLYRAVKTAREEMIHRIEDAQHIVTYKKKGTGR